MEKKKTIQSIDRAASILIYIARHGNDVRMIDISNDLNINKSTIHGILATLESNNLISQNPDTSRYSLGIKLFELGKVYEENFSLKDVVRPYLEKLGNKFSESVHLAIESDFKVLYVDRVKATHSIRLASKPGHTDPLYCTSMGKIILAYKPQKFLETYLERIKLLPLTENTITDRENLIEEIKKIKKDGYAFDNEELEAGLVCIAAPIINRSGKLMGTIGVSGPTNRINSEILEEMKSYIPKIAQEVSNLIGFN